MGCRRRRARQRRRLRRSPGVRDGHPRPGPRSGGIPGRDPEPARLEERRPLADVRPASPVLRHQRREHGQHDQPLHGQQEGPQRRRLQPRRPDRPEAGSRDHALLPASPRGLSRRPRDRRRGRGEPPPAGALRLLERHRQAVDPARLEGRPRRLRHGRAADRRDRPEAGRRRDRPRPARHARASPTPWGRRKQPPAEAIVLPSFEEIKADRFAFAKATRIIHQETNPLNAKALVQYHDRQAVVANPPEPADQRGGHGSGLRPALHPPAASDVPGREDPRVRDRQGFGHDHARLLRRLHVLLDHGPPGADHPVAIEGIGPGRVDQDGAGSRTSPALSRTSAGRRPTCTRCAAPGPRSR